MMHGWGFYGGLGGFNWIGMIVGGIFTLIILVLLILLIIWIIRRLSGRHMGGYHYMQGGMGGQSAKEILQMRYAKGEITQEQYQQMLAELNK
jgi:putative membrane protein